jgi:hypothetical protein
MKLSGVFVSSTFLLPCLSLGINPSVLLLGRMIDFITFDNEKWFEKS